MESWRKVALAGIVGVGLMSLSVSAQLTESGQIVVDGHPTHYLIRRLPVSSFPELPADIQDQLNQRGCLIPQTYAAHHPENVVHASLERAGSSDWGGSVLGEGKGFVADLF